MSRYKAWYDYNSCVFHDEWQNGYVEKSIRWHETLAFWYLKFRLLVEYGNFAAFDLCLSVTKHLKPIWWSCIFHTSFVFIVCILHYRIEISSGEKHFFKVSNVQMSMYALGVKYYARLNMMHISRHHLQICQGWPTFISLFAQCSTCITRHPII